MGRETETSLPKILIITSRFSISSIRLYTKILLSDGQSGIQIPSQNSKPVIQKIKMPKRLLHTLRSNVYIPTLKDVPKEAVLPGYQYLLRAGYIRKTSNGIYSFLPLAMRSLTKLEHLIDQEMQSINCFKTSMPNLLTDVLWKQTGRWESTGAELIRLTDRHGDEFCLAPTHEEIFTELIANTVSSHNQLPVKLYQVGRKFRDEIRPRFGLLRAKEFIMKGQ